MAEAYLKSLAIPNVMVCSSGTVASQDKARNAANFSRALAVLKRHGINQYAKRDYAEDLSQAMLDASDIVVFLNRRAYDEAVRSFKLPVKTYTWHVVDVGEPGRIAKTDAEREAFSEDVYQEIVRNVDDLVRLL
jgi:protein-tyrosine-phosphatase